MGIVGIMGTMGIMGNMGNMGNCICCIYLCLSLMSCSSSATITKKAAHPRGQAANSIKGLYCLETESCVINEHTVNWTIVKLNAN